MFLLPYFISRETQQKFVTNIACVVFNSLPHEPIFRVHTLNIVLFQISQSQNLRKKRACIFTLSHTIYYIILSVLLLFKLAQNIWTAEFVPFLQIVLCITVCFQSARLCFWITSFVIFVSQGPIWIYWSTFRLHFIIQKIIMLIVDLHFTIYVVRTV